MRNLRVFKEKIRTPFICLLFALTLSCGPPREKYAGRYEAAGDESIKEATVSLELKEDGQAVQRIGDDEVSFGWKVKGDEIRLHTKAGGIIIGKIEDGAISVKLPGGKLMVFRKLD